MKRSVRYLAVLSVLIMTFGAMPIAAVARTTDRPHGGVEGGPVLSFPSGDGLDNSSWPETKALSYKTLEVDKERDEHGIVSLAVGEQNYSFDASSGTITKYLGQEKELVIPRTIGGVTVRAIGNTCFMGDRNLESVEIPDCVESIGNQSFQGCQSLTSIEIPSSVATIGYDPFGGCISLAAIQVSENNAAYTSLDGVLFNKSKTSLLRYPIGKNQHSYAILDGVTTIGDNAFASCEKLINIEIPESVSEIGTQAFSSCRGLTGITLPNGILSIEYGTFQFCESLTGIVIPESVRDIKIYAFSYCKNLKKVTIPGNVGSIGVQAFYFCEKLTDLTISNRVTSIGDNAFDGCSSLTSIGIPGSVTSIGEGVFNRCGNLEKISVAANNSVYYSLDGVIFNRNENKIIKYPEGKTDLEYQISDINISKIGNDAFSRCHHLTKLTMHNAVKQIGESVFNGCESLESIELSSGLTRIDQFAFYGCRSLDRITIPNEVTHIGTYAFYGCSNLSTITIPDKVQSIGYAAFASCSLLQRAIFKGDAPLTMGGSPFSYGHSNFMIHHHRNAKGFTNPWHGYPAKAHFSLGIDSYGFSNSDSNFASANSPSHTIILQQDYDKLRKYVKDHYGAIAGEFYMHKIDQFRSKEWGGSCYGMALTAGLNWNNQINVTRNFGGNAPNLNRVGRPADNRRLESMINYYTFAQFLPQMRFAPLVSYLVTESRLKSLVNEIKKNDLVLFGFDSHAVLIYDYRLEKDGSHSLIAYDNIPPIREEFIIRVSQDYKEITAGSKSLKYFDSLSDFSVYDLIDIDGPRNDMALTSALSSRDSFELPATLFVGGASTFSVTNASGEILVYEDGTIGGNMDIKDIGFIMTGSPDHDSAPMTIKIEVADSPHFSFISSDPETGFGVLSPDSYVEVETENADQVEISKASLQVTGDQVAYKAWISVDKDYSNMLCLEGDGASHLQISDQVDGILATGIGDMSQLTSYYQHHYTHTTALETNKDTVLIVDDEEDMTGRVLALISSDDNDIFDTPLPMTTIPTRTFQDVQESHWAFLHIENLATMAIVSGYGTTNEFRPDKKINRQEVSKIVAVSANLTASGDFVSKFSDLNQASDWAREYIKALEEASVVSGFGASNEFRPENNIKRNHAAKMIVLAFELETGDIDVNLNDIDGVDCEEYIRILASNGIVKGYGGSNSFKSDQEISRAEFAKIIDMAIRLSPVR